MPLLSYRRGTTMTNPPIDLDEVLKRARWVVDNRPNDVNATWVAQDTFRLAEEVEGNRKVIAGHLAAHKLFAREITKLRETLGKISTEGDKDSELGECVNTMAFGAFDGEHADSAFYEGKQSGRFEMGEIARAALPPEAKDE